MGQLEKKRIAAIRVPKLLFKNSGMKSSKIFLFVISSYMYHWSQLLFLSLLSMFITFLFYYSSSWDPICSTVRISGFHPGCPGSTPVMGAHFSSVQTMFLSVTRASKVESIIPTFHVVKEVKYLWMSISLTFKYSSSQCLKPATKFNENFEEFQLSFKYHSLRSISD